jgi:uncharacterized RDD family membrane protein YckC
MIGREPEKNRNVNEEPLNPNAAPVPPPDLPQSPPPSHEGSAAPAHTPPVVKIREATDDDDDNDAAGAIAPFGSRMIAAAIDSLVASGLALAVLFVLPHFASKLAWLVFAAYLVTRDSLPFLPRSVGKTAMKLRVVTLDNQPLTEKWETALIRNGVLAIPFFPLVELFVLLNREDKPERGRRLGDEWAKTKVIVEPAAQEEPPAS